MSPAGPRRAKGVVPALSFHGRPVSLATRISGSVGDPPATAGGNDVLADAMDYFHLWQLPLLGILLFGWIIGGGYLFQRGMASHVTARRRNRFSRGVLVSFLSGTVGLVVAWIFYKIGSLLVRESFGLPVSLTGTALAVVGFLGISYLVVYAMHKLTLGGTLRLWLLPIGGTCILGLAVLASCAIPAYYIRRNDLQRMANIRAGLDNLVRIHHAIFAGSANQLPKSLRELVEKEQLLPEDLKNPADPSREVGFFYMPRRLRSTREEGIEELIIASFPVANAGRLVLYTHGEANYLGEESFQSLLARPENQEFAKALQKATEQ